MDIPEAEWQVGGAAGEAICLSPEHTYLMDRHCGICREFASAELPFLVREMQEHLDKPSPAFSLLQVSDLVPEEQLPEFADVCAPRARASDDTSPRGVVSSESSGVLGPRSSDQMNFHAC